MKKCRKCNNEKPIADYYKHRQMADGHLNICKECIKTNVRSRREKYPQKVRAYDDLRAKDPNRISMARKITKNRRHMVSGYQSAHNALTRAVRAGKVNKPQNCEACNVQGRIVGHHKDYSKPLEVIWLCASCHAKLHSGKTESAQAIRSKINAAS